MAISFQCTFDAADPHRLAEFWASALGYRVTRPTTSAGACSTPVVVPRTPKA
jgi:hypothetical protein